MQSQKIQIYYPSKNPKTAINKGLGLMDNPILTQNNFSIILHRETFTHTHSLT